MNKVQAKENRRDFLKTLVPASALLCFGCPSALSAESIFDEDQLEDFNQKIKTKIEISYKGLFARRFNGYIETMKKFAEYMGEDKLIEMLKRAKDDINLAKEPNTEAKSVKDFGDPIFESDYYNHCLDFEALEYSDHVLEIKVANCLWAKTFNNKNAGNIGYASVCHGDFSGAKAFNPKLRMERTKTLMQGHDCCNHRYIWEG